MRAEGSVYGGTEAEVPYEWICREYVICNLV